MKFEKGWKARQMECCCRGDGGKTSGSGNWQVDIVRH